MCLDHNSRRCDERCNLRKASWMFRVSLYIVSLGLHDTNQCIDRSSTALYQMPTNAKKMLDNSFFIAEAPSVYRYVHRRYQQQGPVP